MMFRPATAIKSQVTDNMNIGDEAMRKPEIFADACVAIALEDSKSFTGNTLLDEVSFIPNIMNNW